MPEFSALRTLALELRRALSRSLDQQSLVEAVNGCVHPVILNRADGTIVATNSSFDRFFLGGHRGLGKNADEVLEGSLASHFRKSDQLIREGCSVVEFEHSGLTYFETTREKVLADLRTVKLSLDGIGLFSESIVGVVQVVRQRTSKQSTRNHGLNQFNNRFRELSRPMQTAAKLLAQGKSLSEISTEIGVSRRTVEKYRSGLLTAFQLENTIQISQMMCRLQDSGMAEFGIFEVYNDQS